MLNKGNMRHSTEDAFGARDLDLPFDFFMDREIFLEGIFLSAELLAKYSGILFFGSFRC